MDVYIESGISGHASLFLFLAALVFAWVIHCRGAGLRPRVAFFLLSLMPLLFSIFSATLQVVRTIRSATHWMAHPSGIGEPVFNGIRCLGIVTIGSLVTALLLVISSLLFLSQRSRAFGKEANFHES